MDWYVLRTKCRQEKFVLAETTRRSIMSYLPQVRRIRKQGNRTVTVESPIFSGYLFVKPAKEQIWSLNYIPGSCGLVQFSNGPGLALEREIENIRVLVESGMPFQVQNQLFKGDRVVIRSGPLKGIEGELIRVNKNDRIVLNAFVLGKSLSVEIGTAEVERIAPVRSNGS